jgi:cysteinyl-tRNA synthetase
MPLRLYNTLSRQKEIFEPLASSGSQSLPRVSIYVCGVTVYDFCHLGHARTYTVWDTLRRYLKWLGYPVFYVQNFTDVDDKIIQRAATEGRSIQEVTQRYIAAYFEDMERLNILPADAYPQATQYLPAMIDLIQSLELQHFAYRVQRPSKGAEDVYYAVRQFPTYGKLSGRKLADLQAGASGRVDQEAGKQDPFDFALWKAAGADEPGFDSPWGRGRPGWHIECSAMVKATLGEQIDIHAGGADLIFPHHENEIAQSEALTQRPLARYWLHNGFLNIQGEKMSKSLGNFTTLRDALQQWDPMVLRLFFLQTHYRSPIDLTETGLEGARNGWQTLSKGLQAAQGFLQPEIEADPDLLQSFQEAMDDDLGTPSALALVFELAKELIREQNVQMHQGQPDLEPSILASHGRALLEVSETLGLRGEAEPESAAASGPAAPEIEAKIEARTLAKKAKNFAEADRIRDELRQQGIQLIDQPGGITRWIRE